jgi:hypothetical protein
MSKTIEENQNILNQEKEKAKEIMQNINRSITKSELNDNDKVLAPWAKILQIIEPRKENNFKLNNAPLANIMEAVDAVLDNTIMELENVNKAKPRPVLQENIVALKAFQAKTRSSYSEVQEFEKKRIGDNIVDLAEYTEENSPLGKLLKIINSGVEVAKNKLNTNVVTNNKVLKAAWKLVEDVCELMQVTIKGTLDKAIAVGKVAGSIKELVVAVINSVTVNTVRSVEKNRTAGRAL